MPGQKAAVFSPGKPELGFEAMEQCLRTTSAIVQITLNPKGPNNTEGQNEHFGVRLLFPRLRRHVAKVCYLIPPGAGNFGPNNPLRSNCRTINPASLQNIKSRLSSCAGAALSKCRINSLTRPSTGTSTPSRVYHQGGGRQILYWQFSKSAPHHPRFAWLAMSGPPRGCPGNSRESPCERER